jgi:MSHA pilin protein MshD
MIPRGSGFRRNDETGDRQRLSRRRSPPAACRGLTLVELIVFIVIVSAAVAGVLSVYNVVVRASADPAITKQTLAIAEAVLEEAQLKPFTFCDPADAAVYTAVDPAACTVSMDLPANWLVGGLAGNCRAGDCNHVAKYHGFAMNDGNGGIRDLLGTANPRLAGYSAAVTVTALPGAAFGLDEDGDALRIEVLVQRGASAVTLSGFRLRHTPNAPG